MVNGEIEFLKSVQPPDLAMGRFCHGLEVLERGAVGVDNDWESVQVVPPLGGRFHESQEFIIVHLVVNLVLVEFSRHANDEAQSFLVIFLTEHGSHSSV